MLLFSRTRTNFCNRAFCAAGPRVWNYLSMDLRQPDLSYSRFRQSLKTFLFDQWDRSAVWISPLNCTLEIYLLTYLLSPRSFSVSHLVTPHVSFSPAKSSRDDNSAFLVSQKPRIRWSRKLLTSRRRCVKFTGPSVESTPPPRGRPLPRSWRPDRPTKPSPRRPPQSPRVRCRGCGRKAADQRFLPLDWRICVLLRLSFRFHSDRAVICEYL